MHNLLSEKKIDKKAEARWEMLNISMLNFQNYIKSKKDRCSLSMIGFLYVSNFKGGNASIAEPEKILQEKLHVYQCILNELNYKFKDKKFLKYQIMSLGSSLESA